MPYLGTRSLRVIWFHSETQRYSKTDNYFFTIYFLSINNQHYTNRNTILSTNLMTSVNKEEQKYKMREDINKWGGKEQVRGEATSEGDLGS